MMNGVFLETLKVLGWPKAFDEKSRGVLIGALDIMDCGVISLADLEWLDKWRPVDWVYAEPDPAALMQIKAMLQEKYEHPLRAWRCLLDADDSNLIDWQEFKTACQKLKYKGNVAGAWRALDVDLIGKISMKQYDLASATLLASFKEWAEAHFGSIGGCFHTLDTDSSGALTFTELRRACKKFSWEGDVRLLFECLDVDRIQDANSDGKRTVSYHEIAFLDSWYIELSEEELKRHERALAPPKQRPITCCVSKRVAAITDRLAGLPPPDVNPAPKQAAGIVPTYAIQSLSRRDSDEPWSMAKPMTKRMSQSACSMLTSWQGLQDQPSGITDVKQELARPVKYMSSQRLPEVQGTISSSTSANDLGKTGVNWMTSKLL